MHSYETTKTTFNYNTDLSGDVYITNDLGDKITISGKDIIDFIAYCYILPKKIEKLEQMSSIEITQI